MKRRRPADSIAVVDHMPSLPRNGKIVAMASPLDLARHETYSCIAWDPRRCVQGGVARMEELMACSTRMGDTTRENEVAWTYLTGGPRCVENWDELEPLMQRCTRSELGLVGFSSKHVRMWMVDDSDDAESSSEEEEEAAARSEEEEEEEEVSSGPMDTWLQKRQ